MTYLSWCEYCYMTKVVKTDYKLAKLLSYNCRYLDDICTINLKYFGDIAKDIYDNTLILEGSACSYKQSTFLDIYIRVVDEKFVTGIYHKVDDFNFEVISFPFPQSNINTMLGYTTFYSQLIRFSRLCNNINDFLFLFLSTVAIEHSIVMTTKLRSLIWLIQKTPLLHM